jgi:hypothetical protein
VRQEEESPLCETKSISAVVGGAIPMIFVTYTTAPFVSYAHIRLPQYARRSREQLARWIKNIPPNTEIYLTTMQFSGRGRVSRMLLSDLKETKARLGVANLARKPSSVATPGRKWWRMKEPNLFYIASQSTMGGETKVWQTSAWQKTMWRHVLNRIRNNRNPQSLSLFGSP